MDHVSETVEEPAGEEATLASPVPDPGARRILRLAVTLHPIEGGYRALLAVGADDCDPLLQQVEVDGWPALAQALQDLTDAAAIRWREQPRHPAFTPSPKPTPPPKRLARATEASTTGSAADNGETTPAAEEATASSGQLTLFDPGG